MKKIYRFLLITVLFLVICSCRELPSKRISELVIEWNDKKIVYPDQMYFTVFGQDTVIQNSISSNKYSIITYADSIGCMSCKLQLRKWKAFISEIDSLAKFSVPVYFFLHPKNLDEMFLVLKREQFDYPVCIDVNDSLNILNHFPEEMQFQTFLLDQNNRVIAIGNPVHNFKIRELYLKIISGNDDSTLILDEKLQTDIRVEQESIDMGTFDWHEEQVVYFVLFNMGKECLVIDDVTTSCGCTTVEYSKEPIRPGRKTSLKVKYKSDHPEYFNKTITVYCNATNSPLRFEISGNAK